MKIQKVSSRVYKGKEYHKYILVIPAEDIEKSNLNETDELASEVKNGQILIKRK